MADGDNPGKSSPTESAEKTGKRRKVTEGRGTDEDKGTTITDPEKKLKKEAIEAFTKKGNLLKTSYDKAQRDLSAVGLIEKRLKEKRVTFFTDLCSNNKGHPRLLSKYRSGKGPRKFLFRASVPLRLNHGHGE